MTGYLSTAPLSADAEELLKDPKATRDLVLAAIKGGEKLSFQIKTASKTFDVSSSSLETPQIHAGKVSAG